jgi:hypothetical protein
MKIENSPYKVKMNVFIDCCCNGIYDGLIVEGKSETQNDIELLHKAWEELYVGYLEGTCSPEQLKIFILQKDIKLLNLKLSKVNLLITMVQIRPDDDMLNELKKDLALNVKFDTSDKEQFIKDVHVAVTKSKSIILQLKNKQSELDGIVSNNENEESQALDIKYFDTLLNALSDYTGYFIVPEKITVSRFIDLLISRRKFIEHQNSKQNA